MLCLIVFVVSSELLYCCSLVLVWFCVLLWSVLRGYLFGWIVVGWCWFTAIVAIFWSGFLCGCGLCCLRVGRFAYNLLASFVVFVMLACA